MLIRIFSLSLFLFHAVSSPTVASTFIAHTHTHTQIKVGHKSNIHRFTPNAAAET